ncbi:SEC-C metal-binding domain-containing protein [Actinoplanes oblitus]|uniref:SEC-C metal-binding domain-containing protein n=1 Tax=Actinoplanes oblitus TaxID=3040509 RepID=A0ABY8WIH5_9ACTN|nr:SEC-C metal-binding domain-containing protein [Actinoplanes oblitus]WIM97478.1 SEC-C metal-binding domain-containing protein [Actinoplanes oblitus]
MPSEARITHEDLDAIADRAAALDDPSPLLAELVAAVDGDRLADPADVPQALLLAAEIAEATGDLPAALGLAERAVAISPEDGFARACRAELLVKSGRADEGRREFGALRPELLRDPAAPFYLAETLTACDLGEAAEEWLTAAVRSLTEERDPGLDRVEQLFELVKERHRVREELELGHDDLDDLYHEMAAAVDGTAPAGGRAMLFWPEPEFAELLARWPEHADSYHADWDQHRAGVERALAGWSASGTVHLGLLAGSVDGLLTFAEAQGLDPAAEDTHGAYADEIADALGAVEWPPQRNAACWCGSGLKYKKCCLPRSRG